MKTSYFKLIARSNPNFYNILWKELKNININGRIENYFGNKGCIINGNVHDINKILNNCRTLTNLEMVVNHPKKCEYKSNLNDQFRSIQFHKYFDHLDLNKNYEIPNIHCNSINSRLYHENMIKDIFKDSFNNFQINKFKRNVESNIGNKLAKIDDNINKLKSPDFNVHFFKDYYSLTVNLAKNIMHHNIKIWNSEGSILEHIISGLLIKENLYETYQNEKKIKLCDIFCGSGTIVLELLSMLSNKEINRKKEDLDFLDFPIYNKYIYEENKPIEESNKNDIELNYLGFDLNKVSLGNFAKNIEFNKNTYNFKESQDLVNMYNKLPPNINSNLINNNILLSNMSLINNFELYDLDGYDLITNIPYGYNKKIINKSKNSLYKDLDNFLDYNKNKLRNVILLMNKDSFNFSSFSKFHNEEIITFKHSGRQLGFYKFQNKLKTTSFITTQNTDIKDLEPKKDKKKIEVNSKKSKELLKKQEKDRRNLFISKIQQRQEKKNEILKKKIEQSKADKIKNMSKFMDKFLIKKD